MGGQYQKNTREIATTRKQIDIPHDVYRRKSFFAMLWPEGKCNETLNRILEKAFSARNLLRRALITLALDMMP